MFTTLSLQVTTRLNCQKPLPKGHFSSAFNRVSYNGLSFNWVIYWYTRLLDDLLHNSIAVSLLASTTVASLSFVSFVGYTLWVFHRNPSLLSYYLAVMFQINPKPLHWRLSLTVSHYGDASILLVLQTSDRVEWGH